MKVYYDTITCLDEFFFFFSSQQVKTGICFFTFGFHIQFFCKAPQNKNTTFILMIKAGFEEGRSHADSYRDSSVKPFQL